MDFETLIRDETSPEPNGIDKGVTGSRTRTGACPAHEFHSASCEGVQVLSQFTRGLIRGNRYCCAVFNSPACHFDVLRALVVCTCNSEARLWKLKPDTEREVSLHPVPPTR